MIEAIDFESRRILKESEKLIQKAILDYLNFQKGVFAFRVNVQGVPLHDGSGRFRPAPHKGVADVLCSVVGHFLAVEIKTKNGDQSDNQIIFQKDVEKSGGHYLLARSLDDVIKKIDELRSATG